MLLAVAASAAHKDRVAATVGRFGPSFDKWIFVWDGSAFDDDAFEGCRIVRRDGWIKWEFARELLTPQACAEYDYMFFWDDDLDTSQFYPELFLEIMARNRLELAQPALAEGSYVSHRITFQQPGIGRLTDFIEVMAPAWTRDAWVKWHAMLHPENKWGWGYDLAAKSACGYDRMGIVDCTPVTHVQPVSRSHERMAEMDRFFAAHPHYQRASGQVLGWLVF